jgi:hypothetical protein
MTRALKIVVPLAAAATLVVLAVVYGPATVLSALADDSPAVGMEQPSGPATPPSGDAGKSGYRSSPVRLTPEQEKEALDYLKQHRPEIHDEMIALRDRDPQQYRRSLRNVYSFVSRLRKLPAEVGAAHDELQQARLALWRLARDYAKADTPERKRQLESSMREQADRQFRADQIIRRHRLSELEEQIRQLKNELDQRAKDGNSIIQETVEQYKRSGARYGKEDHPPINEKTHPSGKKNDKDAKK